MRKRLLTIIGVVLSIGIANSQIVNIPDANFKNALLTGANASIDFNGDGEIQYSEALAYNQPIDVSSQNINDLTGIEAFVNVPILACGDNNLTRINLSQNVNLERLFCMYNRIENLYLQNNPKLTLIYAYNNNLKRLRIDNGNNIDISIFNVVNNPNLRCIQKDNGFTPPGNWSTDSGVNYSNDCLYTVDPVGPIKEVFVPIKPLGGLKNANNSIVHIPDVNFKNALLNNIPVIDTNGDGEIQYSEASSYSTNYLNVGNNNISDLTGIEAFTGITYLACAGNNLTSLNVSSLTNLEFLYCVYNKIENLYLQHNTKLEIVYCYNNNLRRLNLANGNNINITMMQANNNPQLTCIQKDAGYTPTNNWSKDGSANYSDNCYYTTDPIDPVRGLVSPSPLGGYKQSDVVLYPNPSSNYIQISKEISQGVLFDVNGVKIKNISSSVIDVKSLRKGTYFIQFSDEDGKTYKKKFIKK